MTAQPLMTIGYPRQELKHGDIVQTHCGKCMDRTPHMYTQNGLAKLVCLDGHPEKDPTSTDTATPQQP